MGLRFKHPGQGVSERVESAGAAVERTAAIGAVAFGAVAIVAVMALLVATAALAEIRSAP